MSGQTGHWCVWCLAGWHYQGPVPSIPFSSLPVYLPFFLPLSPFLLPSLPPSLPTLAHPPLCVCVQGCVRACVRACVHACVALLQSSLYGCGMIAAAGQLVVQAMTTSCGVHPIVFWSYWLCLCGTSHLWSALPLPCLPSSSFSATPLQLPHHPQGCGTHICRGHLQAVWH